MMMNQNVPISDTICSIAVSTHGGDCGVYYVIIGKDSNGRLLLADGKRHGIRSLKHKNKKHCRLVDEKQDCSVLNITFDHSKIEMMTDEQVIQWNSQLKKYLKEYRRLFNV